MFQFLLVGFCLMASAAKRFPRPRKMPVSRAAAGAVGGGVQDPVTTSSTGAQRPFAQPRPLSRAD